MPVTSFSVPEKYKYLNGFNNYHEYVDGIFEGVAWSLTARVQV